ncbi:ABC1 kinase family protein [Humibacillus xanthopallidus]|uniref:ABC1 kinase family protein n=1 Tax=Humibacillus xanthopallidus TaxID=412689 RepID=UPI00384E4778
MLEADLGRPASEVFAHVDEEPLAAASVGQVHAARLLTGEAVVVKVQRREARAQVTADLDIVLRLSSWLERTTGWARQLGVRQLAQEFASSLEEEPDYRVELGNLRSVAAALQDSGRTHVSVPTPYVELSSRHVLVMSQMAGRPISQADSRLSTLTAQVRHDMATELLGAMMHQVMVSGVFHADLHPGNIFVNDDGSIGLLDFGSVGRLDSTARVSIGILIASFDQQDTLAATNALLELLDPAPGLDARLLERDIGQLLLRYSGPGASTAGLFIELFRVATRHGIAVPGQVALAFRAIGTLEGSLKALSPGIDVVAETRSQQTELVTEFTGPERVRASLDLQLAGLLPMLERLPRRLNTIVEDLESGRLTIGVRLFGDSADRSFVSGLVHQFVLALLATACTIGGVTFVTTPGGPALTPVVSLWAFLGFTLLFFAFVLAARVLVIVFAGNVLSPRRTDSRRGA